MSGVKIAEAILTLFAGLGVFLYGMKFVSDNLETLAGHKLKNMLAKVSGSKLAGVGIGTVTTAAIQSSGAVSVMTIGFVNSGIVTLKQAACIIFGANIGTTITAQIVALGVLGSESISISIILASLAGVGAFIALFCKKPTLQKVGAVVAGTGMLFVGLNLMSDSMKDFATLPQLITFLASIKWPFVMMLVGILMTVLLHSSSTVTGIAISMLAGGLLTIDQAIYIAFGSNIGSCSVALIAGLSGCTNAKRTALIHLLFNVLGVVLFMLVEVIMRKAAGISYGMVMNMIFPSLPETQLAMMHTFFNIITVILVLPFTDLMVKLVTKIIPDKKSDKTEEDKLSYLSTQLLTTPSIAVEQIKPEIAHMAKLAVENFNIAIDSIVTVNVDKKGEFQKRENTLNFLNKEIVKYLVKLSKENISDNAHLVIGATYHMVSDLERVGDYAENLLEYADKMVDSKLSFSPDAVDEVKQLKECINMLYEAVMDVYNNDNLVGLKLVNQLEDQVDDMKDIMGESHVRRLDEGTCTPEIGALYLSLASNTERIADHLTNVATCVTNYVKPLKPLTKRPVLKD